MSFMEQMKRFPFSWICKGGRIKLGYNEFLVMCPYDKSHQVLNHKYGSHLSKCRGNYEREKAAKGEDAVKVCCRFNLNHTMYPPERQYHEHNCDDRLERVPWPMSDTSYENGKPVESSTEKTDQSVAPAELEAETGAVGGEDDGSMSFDAAVEATSTLHMDIDVPIDEAKEGTVPVKKLPMSQWQGLPHAISQTMDPKCFGYIHRKVRPHRRYRIPKVTIPFPHAPSTVKPEDDDDEDWNLPSTYDGPKFDWWQHQHNLRGPSRIYPPGLSKAQRRQFDIDNTNRLKYEEGIFVEDTEVEEEKKQKKEKAAAAVPRLGNTPPQ